VSTVEIIFAVGWTVFWLYWLVAAFSMKRGHVPWSRELRIRAVIIGAVIVLVRLGAFRGHSHNTDPWRTGVGLVLFAVGLGFAIWARIHIGRNWFATRSTRASWSRVSAPPLRWVGCG
jgi:protein-S-isoprenylcysteine O-methyltransferase Ste14